MKKTGWYNGDQKPVRVGVYERDYQYNETSYCFWDGVCFHTGLPTIDRANICQNISPYQNIPWRGITKGSK